MLSGRWATVVLVSLGALFCDDNALAYRPFVGTDAAVADLGELEAEFGPAEPIRAGSQRLLTSADTVFNLGVAEGWEAVLQGQAETLLSPGPLQTSLLGNEFSVKNIIRDGILEEKDGPNIPVEFGPLLPGINGEPGTGATLGGIVSIRWGWLTAHFNAAAAITRMRFSGQLSRVLGIGPFARSQKFSTSANGASQKRCPGSPAQSGRSTMSSPSTSLCATLGSITTRSTSCVPV
jgi:hypothetical protein